MALVYQPPQGFHERVRTSAFKVAVLGKQVCRVAPSSSSDSNVNYLALLERPVHGPHLLAFERKDFAVFNATMIVPREKHMCFIKTGRLPEDQKIHLTSRLWFSRAGLLPV